MSICMSLKAKAYEPFAKTYNGIFPELGEGTLVIYTTSNYILAGEAIINETKYILSGTYQNDKAQIDLNIGDDTHFMLDLKSWQYGTLRGKLIKGVWDEKLGKVELNEVTPPNKFTNKNWTYTGDKYHALDVSFAEYKGSLYMSIAMMTSESTEYPYYHGKLQKIDNDTYRLKSTDECDLIIYYNASHDLEIHPADKNNINCSAVKGHIIFEAEIE